MADSERSSPDGTERRRAVWLTDEQIQEIAERAKTLAMQEVYADIGKSVIRVALYILGAAGAALAAWLGLSGKLPPAP